MSVVGQQIATIEKAKAQRAIKILFQETTLKLDATCAVFGTMNPDYAGEYHISWKNLRKSKIENSNMHLK